MKVTSTYAAIVALLVGVKAMHLRDPIVTKAFKLPHDGMSPTTTPAPEQKLFRRIGTVLYAPNNTCGYISGGAFSCKNVYLTCAFSKSGAQGHLACCNYKTCGGGRYDCIDYENYYSSSACNKICSKNTSILKCTHTTARYCNTVSFPGGIIDYWCKSWSHNGILTADTTYPGGDAIVYSTLDTTSAIITSITVPPHTVTAPPYTVTAPPHTVTASPHTVTASPYTVTTSPHTVITHASTTTSEAGGGGGGGGGSSIPIGAIVGGAVGGIAGLALIGAIIFLVIRSQNNKKNDAVSTTPICQAPPMQQQPGVGPGDYNPVPQTNAAYYDPKNPPYSSSGQLYNQSMPPSAYYQPGSTDPSQIHLYNAAANTNPNPSYNQQNITGQSGFQPQEGVIHEASGNAPGTTGQV